MFGGSHAFPGESYASWKDLLHTSWTFSEDSCRRKRSGYYGRLPAFKITMDVRRLLLFYGTLHLPGRKLSTKALDFTATNVLHNVPASLSEIPANFHPVP